MHKVFVIAVSSLILLSCTPPGDSDGGAQDTGQKHDAALDASAGDQGGVADAASPDLYTRGDAGPVDNASPADSSQADDHTVVSDATEDGGVAEDGSVAGDAGLAEDAAPEDTGDPDASRSDLSPPPINLPPVALDDAYMIKNNAVLLTDDLRLNDRDPDGDALHIAGFASPAHGHLGYLGQGRFRYDPDNSYVGDDLFTYIIDDGRGGQASASVSVQVLDSSSSASNTAPRARADRFTVIGGVERVLPVLDNDQDDDGDTLSLTISVEPSHGSVVVDGQSLRYTGTPGFSGSDRLGYRIEDGNGGSDAAWVNIKIIWVPEAATAEQGLAMHVLAEPQDLVLTSSVASQSLVTLTFTDATGGVIANQVVGVHDLPRLQTPAHLGYHNGFTHLYITDAAGQVQGLAQASFDEVSDFYSGPVYTYAPEAYPMECLGGSCSSVGWTVAAPDSGSSTVRVASTGTFRAATLSDDPPWVYMGRGADVWTPLRIDLFDALGHPMPEGALVIVFDLFPWEEYPGADRTQPVPHIFAASNAGVDQGTALYQWSDTPALVVRLDARGGFDARYHSPQIDLLTGSSAAAAQNDLSGTLDQRANVHSFNPGGSLDSFWGRTFADGASSTLPHGTGPLTVNISYITPNSDDTYFYSPGEMPSVEVKATVFDGRGRPIPEGAEVDFGTPANWLQVCGDSLVSEKYTTGNPPDLLSVSLRAGPGGSVPLYFTTDPLLASQEWLGYRSTRALEFFVGGRVINEKLNVNAGPVSFDMVAPAAGAMGWPARSTLWPYMSENKIRFTNLTDGAGNPLPKGTPLTVSASHGWVTRPGSFDGNDNMVLVDDNGSVRATFHAHTDQCTPGFSRRAKVTLHSTYGDVLGETSFDLMCPVINFFDMSVGLRIRDIPVVNIPFIIGDLQRVADRGRAHKKRALMLAGNPDSNAYNIMRAQAAYADTFRRDIGQGVATLIKAVPNTSFTGPSDADDLLQQVVSGVRSQATLRSLGVESQANFKQWALRYVQMSRRGQDAQGHACGPDTSAPLPSDAPDIVLSATAGLVDGSDGTPVGMLVADLDIHDNGVLVSGSAMHVGDRDIAIHTVLASGDAQALGFAAGATEIAVFEINSVDAENGSAQASVIIFSVPAASSVPEAPGSATVGVGGGQVGDGQGFVLDIPASALGADTDLVMRGEGAFASAQVNGVPGGLVVRSTRIDAIDSGDNLVGFGLSPAGTLSAGFGVDPGDSSRSDEGVQISSLVLCQWNAAQGQWGPINDSSVDSAKGQVAASVTAGGIYGLAGLR